MMNSTDDNIFVATCATLDLLDNNVRLRNAYFLDTGNLVNTNDFLNLPVRGLLTPPDGLFFAEDDLVLNIPRPTGLG